MEFSKLIEARYSVRAYRPDPVEQEKLDRVLEAARLAPTAVNFQPFQVIVIHTRDREEELNRIYRKNWFVQPPLVVAVCGLHERGWIRRDGKSFLDVDTAIVMDHLILAATNEGLGTCWVGNFDPEAAREVLGLPDGVEPIAFTPLGYPDDEPRTKKRQPLDDLVRYERW
jgi:nitroreductase